jgi:hypothetical protein
MVHEVITRLALKKCMVNPVAAIPHPGRYGAVPGVEDTLDRVITDTVLVTISRVV